MTGDRIRAVRCNNPCNIERNPKNVWQGLMPEDIMEPEQLAEKRFCVFSSSKWGFRAAAVLLIKHQDRDGAHTIAQHITIWAPPGENDTKGYIARVCSLTGFYDTQFLDLQTYEHLAPLVKAMATVECGGWFFDDLDRDAGLRLAGVEAPTPSLTNSRTIQASTIGGGVATATATASQLLQQSRPALDIWREIADYGPWVAIALFVAVIGYIVYRRIDDHYRAIR